MPGNWRVFLFILSNHAQRSFLSFIGKERHDSFAHLSLLLRLTHPSHPYAIQRLAIFSTIKLGQMNLQFLENKEKSLEDQEMTQSFNKEFCLT